MRSRTKIVGILACVLVGLAFLQSCDRTGTLQGDVFIVTQGGQNIKLALVEVQAMQLTAVDLAIRLSKYHELVERASKVHANASDYNPFEEKEALEQLFRELPSGFAFAKTDADGKFALQLDRKETVVLEAHATRLVGHTTETYHWLVRVSLDGEATKRVLLSNDNLITSGSHDSLLHVVE